MTTTVSGTTLLFNGRWRARKPQPFVPVRVMLFDPDQLARQRRAPTVVFLGAGAGIADGLPTTEEMCGLIRDAVMDWRIHPAFMKFPSFVNFLRKGDTTALMELTSEIAACLEKNPVAQTLYRVLGWAAARSSDHPHEGVSGHRRRLLRHLYGRDNQLYVITTNWDTSLDTIVHEIAAPSLVDYGLDHGSAENAELDSSGQAIHLYKLNGSPDWFVCSRCGILATAAQVRVANGYPADWQHIDYDPYCKQCGQWLPRVIVLPSRERAIHPLGMSEAVVDRLEWSQVRLGQLQTHAVFAIGVAGEMLFVGYSLPSYDGAIRDVLQTGVAGNAIVRQGRATITVVARGDDGTQQNFESIYGATRFRFVSTGLESYLSEIGA